MEGKKNSQAGKKVLIKAMAQAIPTYTISCFHLSNYIYKQCVNFNGLIFFEGNNERASQKIWGVSILEILGYLMSLLPN